MTLKEGDERRNALRETQAKTKGKADRYIQCLNMVQGILSDFINDANIGKPKGNGKPKAKFIFHISLIEFCQHLNIYIYIFIQTYIYICIYVYYLYSRNMRHVCFILD